MAIDKIGWHLEAIPDDIPEDKRWEKAGAHIGYFIEWAYKKGFVPTDPEIHAVDEYQKVINSEINGLQFLIENCDTKFWEEDLNEQGQKFAFFAYDAYLDYVGTTLGYDFYCQQNLQNVSQYLDEMYSNYLTNPPQEVAQSKQKSLFQKLKDLLQPEASD